MNDDMTANHPDNLDAWYDAINVLAPNTRNARTFPPESPLVHMTGPGGDLVLRQWPAETSAAHLDWLAEGLRAADEATDIAIPVLEPVPDRPDERSILVGGHRYTRSPHLPGRPLSRFSNYYAPDGQAIQLPLPESGGAHAVVLEATRAIAQVHAATGEIAAHESAPTAPLSAMLRTVREIWFEERKTLGEIAGRERDIRRWLRCGNRIVPTASDLLRNEETLMHERSVMVHGNLWPEDVLIEGHEGDRHVTGIAGWSAAGAGSPVLDLAALAVHMQGWSAPLTESIVETYSEIAPLRPEQRRLVPVVASLDLVANLAWLLRLNYLDDRMINHEALPVVRSGMKTLLNSLETLTQILAPDIDVTQRWQRREPGERGTGKRPERNPKAPRRGRSQQRRERE